MDSAPILWTIQGFFNHGSDLLLFESEIVHSSPAREAWAQVLDWLFQYSVMLRELCCQRGNAKSVRLAEERCQCSTPLLQVSFFLWVMKEVGCKRFHSSLQKSRGDLPGLLIKNTPATNIKEQIIRPLPLCWLWELAMRNMSATFANSITVRNYLLWRRWTMSGWWRWGRGGGSAQGKKTIQSIDKLPQRNGAWRTMGMDLITFHKVLSSWANNLKEFGWKLFGGWWWIAFEPARQSATSFLALCPTFAHLANDCHLC